jgi:glucose/arabinose dehydrogenase
MLCMHFRNKVILAIFLYGFACICVSLVGYIIAYAASSSELDDNDKVEKNNADQSSQSESPILPGTITLAFTGDKSPSVLNDDRLGIQLVAGGFDEPSSFEFVGKQDILITQRDDGKVKMIRNFELKKYPILDENVLMNAPESGLLGITSAVVSNSTNVFLLYDEKPLYDLGSDFALMKNNRIYRYVWDPDGIRLSNRTLVLELPSLSATRNLAKIEIGKDGQLYIPVDDLNHSEAYHRMLKEYSPEYRPYNGLPEKISFLRTTLMGLPLTEKGFERSFGIGIRNSFGMAFDPVTGYLWSADEGPDGVHNINLIKPVSTDYTKNNFRLPQDVIILNSSDHRDGETNFSQHNSLSLTALTFVNSSELGDAYTNDLIAGDNKGNLYHFELDSDRENIIVNDNLSSHIIATGFGHISDLKIGPDQSLYILTLSHDDGSSSQKNSGELYRISQETVDLPVASKAIKSDYLWLIGTAFVLLVIFLFYRYSKTIWGRMSRFGTKYVRSK